MTHARWWLVLQPLLMGKAKEDTGRCGHVEQKAGEKDPSFSSLAAFFLAPHDWEVRVQR